MKIIITTSVIWLLLLQYGMSQPLLTNAEKYTPGSIIQFTRADTANVTPGATGANVTWDFSSLNALPGTLQKEALLPSQTAYENDFPLAQWALETNEGTISFFKENADSLWLVGLVQSNAGIKITYAGPVLYFVRNLAFMGEAQGTTRYHYTFSGADYQCGGTFSIQADSYGTLILPGASYSNVMRVKTTGNYYDTMQGPGSYVQATKIVTYSWYNAYNGAPLLTIDSLDISSPFYNDTRLSVSYAQNPANAVGKVDAMQPLIRVYPDRLQVNNMTDNLYNVSLYDMAGRELTRSSIAVENNRGETALPETLSPGCYIIRLENGTQTFQQKLVIL